MTMYVGTFYDYLNDSVENVVTDNFSSCIVKTCDLLDEKYPDTRISTVMEDLENECFHSKYEMGTLLYMLSVNEI